MTHPATPHDALPRTKAFRPAGSVIALALFLAFALATNPALAGSPFATGATALGTNIVTILTPLAVIGVIAIGVGAWFNRVSWGWVVAAMIGIVLVFGATQIVAWIRGMFGV